MEIGVYYGGRLDRLEEITKNLARETGATWGNGDAPDDLSNLNTEAFDYLVYDKPECLGISNRCHKELSADDFIAKVREEQPKEKLEFIPGHLYKGEFSDGLDLFEGICACYEDYAGDISLVSISTNEDKGYYYWVGDLESTNGIKDITEEVTSL
jgi:hypothetical protein